MQKPQGFIWDLDGCLYRYGAETRPAIFDAAVKACLGLGYPLSYDHAYQFMEQHSEVMHAAPALQAEHGICPRQLHRDYHDLCDVSRYAEPLDGLADAFTKIQDRRHVILTHGSKSYALRVVAHIGVGHIFNAHNILGFEDYDFAAKHESAAGVQKALNHLALPPETVVMVEDSPRNLIPAAHHVVTALVHHGQTLPKAEPHVHHVFSSIPKLIAHFA